jgi:hypothetical protein
LEEDQLILFQDGGEMCFCSVLGATGEASAVQVLIGPQSYFWFLKMHNREPISIGD